MGAGFPADLDTFFDMEEDDLDSDYDLAEEEPAHSETTPEAPAEEIPVKAYLVKYTAYKAFVGGSDARSLGYSLMEVQPARDHLVPLFRRDLSLPQRFCRLPCCFHRGYLSICRRGSYRA